MENKEIKPVYYKNSENSEYYKFIITTTDEKDVDVFLDTINHENNNIVTEEEFLLHSDKTMTLDVYDTSDTYKIGELTTRYLEIEDETLI